MTRRRFHPHHLWLDWCTRCTLSWTAHKSRHNADRSKRARCPQ